MARRRYGRLGFESSNEDKVLFPGCGLTKGDLIDYYERIAEVMLPHLREHPLVLQRFPDGIDDDGFYQKQVGSHFPDWISTVHVEVRGSGDGEKQELVVCDRKATLAYLGDQACITLHPWLSRTDALDRPDLLVVDLDPPGQDFAAVRAAARRVRGLFEDLELPCYAKLTGSKGLHVVVPLDRSAGFDEVREFARAAMEVLAARHPDALTTAHRKDKRRGRLYLDVARNAYGQTAVAPYAVRPLPEAPVAVPVAWKEVEAGLGARDYTVRNVFRRLSQREDPWASLRRRARSLDPARERLRRLEEREQD